MSGIPNFRCAFSLSLFFLANLTTLYFSFLALLYPFLLAFCFSYSQVCGPSHCHIIPRGLLHFISLFCSFLHHIFCFLPPFFSLSVSPTARYVVHFIATSFLRADSVLFHFLLIFTIYFAFLASFLFFCLPCSQVCLPLLWESSL